MLSYPDNAHVRRFDDDHAHGLSHCMKAVDVLIEEPNRLIFVEIKDPEQAQSQQRLDEFVERVENRSLIPALYRKYRDSFLYRWAEGAWNSNSERWYVVVVTGLDDALLLSLFEDLKRQLPFEGLPNSWQRGLADKCLVLSLDKWNQEFPTYPLQRDNQNTTP